MVAGADQAKKAYGKTALELAQEEGKQEVVKLLEPADANVRNSLPSCTALCSNLKMSCRTKRCPRL